jgi:predicted nucleic acid-binding protein
MSVSGPVGGRVYIADTSAWLCYLRGRMPEALTAAWEEAIDNNLIARSPFVTLELISTVGDTQYEWWVKRLAGLTRQYWPDRHSAQLALEGFERLRRAHQHLGVSAADLFTAAIAANESVAVLHQDAHYDRLRDIGELDFDSCWLDPTRSI